MVRDILISSMYMLNLSREAAVAESGGGELLARFLRHFNLVVDEVATEYVGAEPKIYGLDDPDPQLFGVTPRVLAYGTAAEYCITEGLADEAVTWDKRYKDGLAAAKKKVHKVRGRRWFCDN